MTKFRLSPSQKHDVRRIFKHPSKGALNASITGAGKTAVGLGLIKKVKPRIALIVAPLNTEDGWRETARSLLGEKLHMLGNQTPEQIHWTRQIAAGVPGVYLVGWEWAATQAEYWDWPVDLVIYDEVHRASTRDTRSADMTYHMGKAVAERGGYRLGLSATPNGNQMSGFWAVAHALWPGREWDWHFHSYWRWARRHLLMEDVYIGDGETREVAGREKVPGTVIEELPLYFRHEERKRCCKFHPKGIQADLPQRVVHRVGVEISPVQRRLYNEIEKAGIAYLEEHDLPIQSEWPMVLNLRMHQVCLAVPSTELSQRWRKDPETMERELESYTRVYYEKGAKSTKIDALMDVLADIEPTEHVVIFTHSQGVIEAVVDRINRQYKGAAAAWDGTVKKRDRAKLKEDFIAGRIRILVCQIAAIAEGVDGLQKVCHNEIWLSITVDGVRNWQASGRLMRRGLKHTINSWRIYAKNTREEDQMMKLEDNRKYLGKALRA